MRSQTPFRPDIGRFQVSGIPGVNASMNRRLPARRDRCVANLSVSPEWGSREIGKMRVVVSRHQIRECIRKPRPPFASTNRASGSIPSRGSRMGQSRACATRSTADHEPHHPTVTQPLPSGCRQQVPQNADRPLTSHRAARRPPRRHLQRGRIVVSLADTLARAARILLVLELRQPRRLRSRRSVVDRVSSGDCPHLWGTVTFV